MYERSCVNVKVFTRVKFSRVLVKRSKIRPSPETLRTCNRRTYPKSRRGISRYERLPSCSRIRTDRTQEVIEVVEDFVACMARCKPPTIYWAPSSFGFVSVKHLCLPFWECMLKVRRKSAVAPCEEKKTVTRTAAGIRWMMWQIVRFSKGKFSLYMKFLTEIMVQWHVCILNERVAS